MHGLQEEENIDFVLMGGQRGKEKSLRTNHLKTKRAKIGMISDLDSFFFV